eukprot:763020-Hanusia_phi.AAC.8
MQCEYAETRYTAEASPELTDVPWSAKSHAMQRFAIESDRKLIDDAVHIVGNKFRPARLSLSMLSDDF